MQRIIRMVPGIAFAVTLSACGGGATDRVVPQSNHTAQNNVRHVKSIPCTLDSYGYCAVLVHQGPLPGGGGFKGYEVYSTGDVDEGQYSYTLMGNGEDHWDPGEPNVVFGDPNLP